MLGEDYPLWGPLPIYTPIATILAKYKLSKVQNGKIAITKKESMTHNWYAVDSQKVLRFLTQER